MQIDFKSLIPHLTSFIAIILISVIYFMPQFQGKELVQTDTLSYNAIAKEAKDLKEKTGEVALWTDAIFGGMPTYQISAPQQNNFVKHIESIFRLGIDRPAGYFIMGMLGFYLLMICMGVGPWLSLIAALLFGLSTNNIVLYDAGHMSKVRAIMSSPLILAGAILVFRKRYLLGGAIFGIFLGLNVYVNHVQMTYYLGMVVGILVLIEVYRTVKRKDYDHVWKSLLILVLGTVLALAASASRIMTTLEYTGETVRGQAVLDVGEDRSTSSSGGMEWDRAMEWSNGTIDLIPSYIPMAAGGGGAVMLDKDSALGKKLGRRQEFAAPMYHGDLTFTGGPIYFGAVAFFLFLFGVFAVRGPLKWWLVSAVILTFIMSMGKNFPVINRLIFDYAPFFNKFRTPNSVLSITALLIPILGVLGMYRLTSESKDRSDYLRPAWIAFGLTAGTAVIFALLGGMFFDFSHARDQYEPAILEAIKEDRLSLLRSSSLRTAAFIAVGFAAIYAYIKNKIPMWALLLIVGLAGVLDLWQIDKQYLGNDKFQTSRQASRALQPRPVDEQIMSDTDLHYRVHDITSANPFSDAIPASFHKLVGGYHPAKLQRYDDLIQTYISRGNMPVLNMLNTKYLIVKDQNGAPAAQRNPSAMGNAWFVNEIQVVSNANEEFEKLSDFDPAVTGIVHKEYSDYLSGFEPNKNGSIRLTGYSPNELVYEYSASSEQLAIFSEIWYGPDKGWQAYLDDEPVDHIRANYILRALKVPAGTHTVRFTFNPSSYATGEYISLIASLLLIGAVIVGIYFYARGKNQGLPTVDEVLDTDNV